MHADLERQSVNSVASMEHLGARASFSKGERQHTLDWREVSESKCSTFYAKIFNPF